MTGRKVAFGSVEIIELPYTIGHGPTSGAPVSLGWDLIDRSLFNLDFFEHYRPPRRTKPALRLSAQKRRYLLLKNGHSMNEIELCEMEALRLRKERIMSIRLQRKVHALEMKPVVPKAA